MKKVYLVAHWCASRGQSESNPAYLFGPYNYFTEYPLQNIKPEKCYKTRNAALRAVEKNTSKFWRASVVEVPSSAFCEN